MIMSFPSHQTVTTFSPLYDFPLIYRPKHMLCVKRAVSMARFFCAPKTNVKIDGRLFFKIYAKTVYLDLFVTLVH